MADYTAYFNGEWVPFSQVKIDPMDRGFLVGDVVFDVERTFNGKSFRMREHIDRLYRSLKFVRIDPGLSPDEMLAISEEVIERNEALREAVGDPPDFPNNQMPLGVGPILTYAIYWSSLRFIEELLAIGADPNGHDNDGFPPLIARDVVADWTAMLLRQPYARGW